VVRGRILAFFIDLLRRL